MNKLSTTLREGALSSSRLLRVKPSGGTVDRVLKRRVDHANLIDATCSMLNVIESAKRYASRTVHRLAADPRIDLRWTCGFYRDHDCAEPFRFFGSGAPTDGEFAGADSADQLDRFLRGRGHTETNSTIVEALGAALYHVSRLPWSAPTRVLLHIGDQPSHGFNPSTVNDGLHLCPFRMTQAKILAALKEAGVTAYMVRCGYDADAERQYREIAEATGGAYMNFADLGGGEALFDVQEFAIRDAAGEDVRALIEERASSGQLEGGSARALLQVFDKEARGGSG